MQWVTTYVYTTMYIQWWKILYYDWYVLNFGLNGANQYSIQHMSRWGKHFLNVQQYSAQENMVMLWNSFANMLGDAWFNGLHICNDSGVTTSYDMHTQVQIAY